MCEDHSLQRLLQQLRAVTGRTIVITVDGGRVSGIETFPAEEDSVLVLDYDVEGSPENEMEASPGGDPCIVEEWGLAQASPLLQEWLAERDSRKE